jgi:hypothetical protein
MIPVLSDTLDGDEKAAIVVTPAVRAATSIRPSPMGRSAAW